MSILVRPSAGTGQKSLVSELIEDTASLCERTSIFFFCQRAVVAFPEKTNLVTNTV